MQQRYLYEPSEKFRPEEIAIASTKSHVTDCHFVILLGLMLMINQIDRCVSFEMLNLLTFAR